MMKLGIFATIVLACLMFAGAAPAGAQGLTPLMPDTYGFYNLKYTAQVGTKSVTLPCRVFVPKGYETPKSIWPALIYLHREEDRGSDLAAIATSGPELKLRQDQGFRDNFKFITLSPQCPPEMSWDDPQMAQAVLGLIDELGRSFHIDPDRVCLSGTGMGVAGATRVAGLAPDRFSAIAVNSPVQGLTSDDATKIKHVAAFVTASPNDKATFAAYMTMVESLGNAHGDVQFARVNSSPIESSKEFFNNNQTYDWLAGKHRRTAQERKERDDRDAKQLNDELARLPKTAGDYKLMFETWVGDKKQTIPYMASLPRGYEQSKELWPVMVFLHGAGEGDPNLGGVYIHGPMAHRNEDPAFKDWFPFILIFPIHDNSPERAQGVIRLVDTLAGHFRCDPDRYYLTGFSLGGTSTWTVAVAGPDRFACIAPISPRAGNAEQAVALLKTVPTWIICGGGDGDFTVGANRMFTALQKAGGDVHLTLIPGEGHGSWPRYYQDRRFYDWFLQHRRPTAAERAEREKRGPVDPLAAPLQPGTYWLEFPITIAGKPAKLPFAVYLPKAIASGEKLPLLLYLHRDDERTTDQSMVFDWGSDTDPRRDPSERNRFPMIGLSPQCPNGKQWSDPEVIKGVLGLMDGLAKKLPIDADRVYATGMQMGGQGTWQIALESPDRFAAIAPYRAGVPNADQVASKLRYVAARIIAPLNDGGAVQAARQMTDVMRKARADVRVALIPAALDRPTFEAYYLEPDFYTWLLAHRRVAPAERKDRDDRLARAAAAKLPQEPGDHLLSFETRINGKPVNLAYRVYLPKNYNKTPDRLPMLVFLHGNAAAVPTTMQSGEPVGAWGPDLELVRTPKLADGNPLLFVCPQCPPGRRWDEPEILEAALELADDATWRFRVDPNRVYVSGVDAGASAADRVAMEAPDRFAALAPVGAGALPAGQAPDCLRGVPTWFVTDPGDAAAGDVAKKTVDAMRKAQTDAQTTTLPQAGMPGLQQFYADPKFYAWLMAHRRAG